MPNLLKILLSEFLCPVLRRVVSEYATKDDKLHVLISDWVELFLSPKIHEANIIEVFFSLDTPLYQAQHSLTVIFCDFIFLLNLLLGGLSGKLVEAVLGNQAFGAKPSSDVLKLLNVFERV